MKISSIESEAKDGPVLSSLRLYHETVYFGVTTAIYIKSSSN
jgi:hypothetical protein